MSNAVGKAREHEKWERWRKEGRLRSKITRKSMTNDEIRRGVLRAIKDGKVSLRDLPYMLRLSVGNWSRLNETVLELEREGKLRIHSLSEGKTIEAIA